MGEENRGGGAEGESILRTPKGNDDCVKYKNNNKSNQKLLMRKKDKDDNRENQIFPFPPSPDRKSVV